MKPGEINLGSDFDRVLADVPCSGTGTIARNPESKWRLKPEDLSDLHRRQCAILNAALDRLGPEGTLVYSTCSLEKEENSDVVEEVLGQRSGFRLLDCRDRLRELSANQELAWPTPESLCDGPFLRTIPGVHPGDGFFAAMIERASG
jgi:16S rRNA (cytosine967-C5)-methyltransferase